MVRLRFEPLLEKEPIMWELLWDALFPVLSIVLFAGCALLVRGCERV